MVRGSLLPVALLALGCLASGHARPETGPSLQRDLLALPHTRQLQQGCRDQWQDCTLWAQQGLCGPDWVWNGKPVGSQVCPVSCLNCTGFLDQGDWYGIYPYSCNMQGVPQLVHDRALTASAQAVANTLAASCTLEPSGTAGVGENMAAGFPCWVSTMTSWYNEAVQYDFNNPGPQPGTGNFTQLIWKSTANVGCGIANNPSCPYYSYRVCHYTPAGNVDGQFADNVPPCNQPDVCGTLPIA